MELNEDQFQKLRDHLVSQDGARPPQFVFFAAASLLADPDSIRESLCSYRPGPNTTVWVAHLLTDGALIVIRVEVEAEQYDLEEEYRFQAGGNAQNAPHCQIKEAWARPLGSITSCQTDIQPMLGSDWFGAQVQLSFAGVDEPVALPAQRFGNDPHEQERSDKFLEALRKSISWLG
jgi:hypothetical protein